MNTPWRITLADVVLDEHERDALAEVLASGWLSMGPVTERFERDFAGRLGGGAALAVSNGTAALHLAALALGIGAGDEVICPSLTFVATAAAMRHTGAEVRLADSTSLDDFALDPREIDRLVTARTRAVVLVHYGGFPADVEGIREAAGRHGLLVLEDAAHALGATLEGVACGRLADAGCFSFFPNKNMTTGEGGMLVLEDGGALERARLLRSHGMTSLTWDRHRGHASDYDVVALGFNYRLDELRAALGIVQLARLDGLNEVRAALYRRYRDNLDGGRFALPGLGGRGQASHHLAVVVAPSPAEREDARARLRDHGIQSSVHYPAIHRFTYYRRNAFSLPVSEAIADRALTLPLHPRLTEADVDEICGILASA